jgi:hypothetical protein
MMKIPFYYLIVRQTDLDRALSIQAGRLWRGFPSG